MDIFCAYFDVQGFYINGLFHPAEVCMITKKDIYHVKVKKSCNCNPTKQEQKNITYLTKYHHGLEITEEGIHFKRLRWDLKKIYNRVLAEPSIYIACKSKEAAELLDFYSLPNLNLNDFNVNHVDIDTGRRPCRFHDQSKQFKCSYNIVKDLKRHVRNMC